MKRKLPSLFGMTLIALVLSGGLAYPADDLRITKEELRRRIDNPDVIIVDVRTEPDWKASEVKIKRALYVPLSQVGKLAHTYSRDITLVFYCA